MFKILNWKVSLQVCFNGINYLFEKNTEIIKKLILKVMRKINDEP